MTMAIPPATYSRVFLQKSFFSNLDARLRISSTDMRVPSTGCCCHNCCMGVLGVSVTALPSLVVEPSQNVLDSVNFRRHVSRGKPSDLADLIPIQTFQIRQDHVAIQRFQPLNHLQ